MHHWLLFFQEPEPTVTITFQPSQLLTWLFVGLIAGALANTLTGRRISFGGSLIIGLLGALVGGFLFTLLQIPASSTLDAGIFIRWIDIIVAFVGALIVLVIYNALFGRRWRN